MTIIRHLLAAACLTASAHAITLADLAPGALAGKTLQFTFEGGNSVPPPVGTWTAAFTATNATIANFPGVAGSHVSTWAYVGPPFPDAHGYALSASPAFGDKAATLDMWISTGGGRFLLTVDGIDNFGSVDFAPAPAGPEISVIDGGKALTDGKSTIDLGPVRLGKSGLARKIRIKNTGTAPLKNIAIAKTGASAADFIIGKPGKTTIPAGGSTTFTVTFKPKAKGTRRAAIAIRSNDKDENPFNLGLTGNGVTK
jgi:hypothetical protein